MSAEDAEVLAANEGFYRAFNARDVEAMERLWARDTPVMCVHPGWAALRDRASVMGSWRAIFRGGGAPRVEVLGARAVVSGGAAWVVCYERVGAGAGETLAATNVFVREGGSWKMVMHHSGPVAQSIPPGELVAVRPAAGTSGSGRGRPN